MINIKRDHKHSRREDNREMSRNLPVFKTHGAAKDVIDSYKSQYKTAKHKLKELEKQNEAAQLELERVMKEEKRLWKEHRNMLDRLAKTQMLLEPSSDEENVTIPPSMLMRYGANKATVDFTSSARTYQPEKRLAKKVTASKDAPITSTKPKRKSRQDRDGPRKVQNLKRDEEGNFVLPVKVGIFTVVDLGQVEYEREAFHSERYIYPVGLKVMRFYRSTVRPTEQACYTSTVEDNGVGPLFKIIADDTDQIFTSDSSSGAWGQIIKAATKVRNLKVTSTGSGPEFLGIAHATMAYMIQNLPNAEKCKNYKMQEFDILPHDAPQGRSWVAPPLPLPLSTTVKLNNTSSPRSSESTTIPRIETEPSAVGPPASSPSASTSTPVQMKRQDMTEEEDTTKVRAEPKRVRIWE